MRNRQGNLSVAGWGSGAGGSREREKNLLGCEVAIKYRSETRAAKDLFGVQLGD